jgi:integrase
MIDAVAMTYLVKRKGRFYVVVYDGLDALTGRERRRRHPAGTDRREAETVVARLQADRVDPPPQGAVRSRSASI